MKLGPLDLVPIYEVRKQIRLLQLGTNRYHVNPRLLRLDLA